MQGLFCLFLVAVVVIVSETGSLYLTQDVFEITPGPRFGSTSKSSCISLLNSLDEPLT